MGEYQSGLKGTGLSRFRLGLAGFYLATVSNKIRALLSDGTTDAPLVGSKVSSSGDSIGLNEDAASTGSDWTLDIARPATGMTQAVQIILPSGAAPTVGQRLSVASAAAGVITLAYQDTAIVQDLTSGATVAAPGSGTVVVTYTANDFCQFVFTHSLGRRLIGPTVYNKAALTGVPSIGTILNVNPVCTSTTVTITFYGTFADLAGIGTGTQGSALELVYG
jgi:hypothetical protein